ncbi:MAG: hypothetical protein WBA97_00020 [Actinophytocola sp.]|uniref:hypothetical protein n=1 Tax=Actinophytocola sp. TaxID=1872138 RepID=UPI003C7596A6
MVMSRRTGVVCGAFLLVVVAGYSAQNTAGGHKSAGSASEPVSTGAVPSSQSSGAVPSRRVFANPNELTAQDALGDLTLLNPCSVVDPDALPDSWIAVIDIPVAFNFCEIAVTTKEGAVLEVRVGKPRLAAGTGKNQPVRAREAGISIASGLPEIHGSCSREVVFADYFALGVHASIDTSMGTTDPCVVSDTIADHVVSEVLDGRAESLTFSEHSLGRLDACTLVGPDLLAAVPGLGADAEPAEFIAGHSCWWENVNTRAMLDLEFGVGHLPVGHSGTTLHGRYTATTQYADSEQISMCEVSGEHVPFEYENEMAILERVTIFVQLPAGQGGQACVAATAVADGLWQTLPPL